MAIWEAPRKERKLNVFYAEQGGIRRFVLDLVDKGAKVTDIATQISRESPETISYSHLYKWIGRWKKQQTMASETQNVAETEVMNA